jgi:hypothetical protein
VARGAAAIQCSLEGDIHWMLDEWQGYAAEPRQTGARPAHSSRPRALQLYSDGRRGLLFVYNRDSSTPQQIRVSRRAVARLSAAVRCELRAAADMVARLQGFENSLGCRGLGAAAPLEEAPAPREESLAALEELAAPREEPLAALEELAAPREEPLAALEELAVLYEEPSAPVPREEALEELAVLYEEPSAPVPREEALEELAVLYEEPSAPVPREEAPARLKAAQRAAGRPARELFERLRAVGTCLRAARCCPRATVSW